MKASVECTFYTSETGQWVFEVGTLIRRCGVPQKWFKRFETPEKDESTRKITEQQSWSDARYAFIYKMFAEHSNSIADQLLSRAESNITETWETESPSTAARIPLLLTMSTDGSSTIETGSGYQSTTYGSKTPQLSAQLSVAMAADSIARMLDYYTQHPQEES